MTSFSPTTPRESPCDPGRIPSLDGLRAASIGLVLVSHSMIALARDGRFALPAIATPGATGVAVFFTISGFIITTLLVREHQRTGTVDLAGFYVRRAFRILPALWVFLAVSALVAPPMGTTHYVRAVFFLSDYWTIPHWWLAHTWSLSVEEQFYLLWPLALWYLGPRRAATAAAILVVGAPLMRVACYFALPALRGQVSYNFHTNVDAIMVGCLVALLKNRDPNHRLLRTLSNGAFASISAVFLLIVHPLLVDVSPGKYVVSVGLSLRSLAAGAIVAWAVAATSGPVSRLLNARALTHLGLISYSLYLWQQPFFDPTVGGTGVDGVVLALGGSFALAQLSYSFVEQPVLALRKRLTRRAPSFIVSPPQP